MERQKVLYLDNCVFSELLKPNASALRRAFASLPHCIAFSDVHILEMCGNHEEYSRLLVELNALFIRNPGQIHEQYHSVSCLEFGEPEERFARYFEFSSGHKALDAMLLSMHHIFGGRRERSMTEVVDETESKMSHALGHLLRDVPGGDQTRLWESLEKTTEKLASLETSEGWTRKDAIVSAARLGDPMRDMDPVERVHFVLSKLEETERRIFTETFPVKFAQVRTLKTGELGGFALALFGMGLTKQKGIFSGPQQEKKFLAQFRDARHIEEASRCDVFMTFDRAASELAASSFAYAGFPTKTVLLSTG